MSRLTCFLLLLSCAGCATGGRHGGGAPVSWTISESTDPAQTGDVVCRAESPAPCALDRSTPEQPRFGTFTLHVFGATPTTFSGSLIIGFLEDPDPRRYKSDVSLTSQGQEVHQAVLSRVTAREGAYSVSVQLQEQGPDRQQLKDHAFSIPVTVQ